jgi:hypothetical protein
MAVEVCNTIVDARIVVEPLFHTRKRVLWDASIVKVQAGWSGAGSMCFALRHEEGTHLVRGQVLVHCFVAAV